LSSVLELLLADARTPTGGYAHSGGLEAADLEPSEVLPFMRARLWTVGRVEASFAAAAWRAASVSELLELEVEWAARTLAEPLRRASRQLGRGLLRTAVQWFPDSRILRSYFASSSELTPRPIALGAVAAAGGLLPIAAARASLYDDAATVAAAAVKLLPLDAAVSSGWVLSLADEIDSLAFEATAAAASGGDSTCFGSTLASLPSTATPLLDRRALTHASTDRRLFAS
jgi:urease accessory protein